MSLAVKASMQWLKPLALLLLSLPCSAAPAVGLTTIRDFAAAPVLVTGRVISVDSGQLVREPSVSSNHDLVESTAMVQVLRSRSSSAALPAPAPAQTIRIRFYALPELTRIRNRPNLPSVAQGDVIVFPLRAFEDVWRLSDDSGTTTQRLRATVETIEPPSEIPDSEDYLLNEIASVLAYGTAHEVYDLGQSLRLRFFWGSPQSAAEVYSRMEAAIGDDLPRWAVLANLLGQPVAEFGELRARPLDAKEPQNGHLLLVASIAQRLPQTSLIDGLIADALLKNLSQLPGQAGLLREVADHPLFIAGLSQALARDEIGSSYLAWEAMRVGQMELSDAALARALRIAACPESEYREISAAGSTVRDFDSESDLRSYAALVRKYSVADEGFYTQLWQRATGDGAPSSAYVLAVVLEDQRTAYEDVRNCDLAVHYLARATGQDFGYVPNGSLAERNRTVQRAFAWLRTEGIVD